MMMTLTRDMKIGSPMKTN